MVHNMARRLCVWRNPSRLCLPPSGPRPALRLNPFLSLAREQHNSAHLPLARDPKFTAGLGAKIFEISSQDLEPSPTPVSQDSGFKVVSTFNTIRGTASPVSVPGSPPSWKAPKLPMCLPEAAPEISQSEGRSSEQLSRLDLSINTKLSDFRYDGVDIVTHASLLRKLLMFSQPSAGGGRAHRLSLRMTQGTLRIAEDPLMRAWDNLLTALHSAVLKHCTETAPGLEDSIHYRSVQYKLGQLSCVVQREVDVLSSTELGKHLPSSSPPSVESVVSQGSDPRGEPALVTLHLPGARVQRPPRSIHWLSRIPVSLVARVSRKGIITKVVKGDVTAAVGRWEKVEKNQVALRKLATLLSELKRAVTAGAPDGQDCIGIIDRHKDVPRIRLYLPEGESKMAPEDIGNKFELGETSRGQDEALDRERQSPTNPP